MKQGTVSVLLGAHSPMHSLLVVVAWIKLYHKLPRPWEFVCIFIHDLGHWGIQYLDDYEAKKHHWRRGAALGERLFGLKAYDLIRGHCGYDSQAQSVLRRPDKYSWLIAPLWWMWTNTLFEPKLVRPGRTRMQSAKDFKRAMLDNWSSGLKREGHQIYLEQWRGEKQ